VIDDKDKKESVCYYPPKKEGYILTTERFGAIGKYVETNSAMVWKSLNEWITATGDEKNDDGFVSARHYGAELCKLLLLDTCDSETAIEGPNFNAGKITALFTKFYSEGEKKSPVSDHGSTFVRNSTVSSSVLHAPRPSATANPPATANPTQGAKRSLSNLLDNAESTEACQHRVITRSNAKGLAAGSAPTNDLPSPGPDGSNKRQKTIQNQTSNTNARPRS